MAMVAKFGLLCYKLIGYFVVQNYYLQTKKVIDLFYHVGRVPDGGVLPCVNLFFVQTLLTRTY